MPQNLASVTLSETDLVAIDQAITTLINSFGPLIDLSTEQRRTINKMGDKSEAFCRQTLRVMAQNPHMVPATVDLADAVRDLNALDLMRGRTERLRQLLGRLDDTELALGSDVMTTALEGYTLLKVLGKGSGLEELRREMGARFAKSPSLRDTRDEGGTGSAT